MNEHTEDFGQWLSGRPKWLQTAASLLPSAGQIDDATISLLADLCLVESQNGNDPRFQPVRPEHFAAPASAQELKLLGIADPVGINALNPNAPLEFEAAQIVVLFGANGAGKSGYARLLKHACGARLKSDLLANVFHDQHVDQAATIHIALGQTEMALDWKASAGPLDELRHVHIFDTECAQHYVQKKNEPAYEPYIMRLITRLADVSDRVADHLEGRKAGHPRTLPDIPSALAGTSHGNWFSRLKASTTAQEIDSHSIVSDTERDERLTLETKLAQADPLQLIRGLREQRQKVVALQAELTRLAGAMDDAAAQKIIQAKADHDAKRRLAEEEAQKVFANAPLDGIGQDSWKALWAHARAYSEQLAYPGQPFPYIGESAHCVLCQQPLSEDSKQRLGSFESFIKAALEKDAQEAGGVLALLQSQVPVVPSVMELGARLDSLQLSDVIDAAAVHRMLAARREALLAAVALPLRASIDLRAVLAAVAMKLADIDRRITDLTEFQQQETRQQHEQRLRELKSKEWLSGQKAATAAEVERLGRIAALDAAKKLTNTADLTRKKNELVEVLQAQAHCERFRQELIRLGGGHIPVTVTAIKEGKAKISFNVKVDGARQNVGAASVLSEGENRIVSLAAFLADVSALGTRTPFIFDDPISSLDQDFEEKVVERLVALARERQVIVFTHRLSLVAQLRDAASSSTPKIPRKVISLLRIGENVGNPERIAPQDDNPEAWLKSLREHVAQAKTMYDTLGYPVYSTFAQGICASLRKAVETLIERVLMDGVVQRFSNEVRTRRLNKLVRIRPEDCLLLDMMMTKYSGYAHSRSMETPKAPPLPDELSLDIQKLFDWRKEFSTRPAQEVTAPALYHPASP